MAREILGKSAEQYEIRAYAAEIAWRQDVFSDAVKESHLEKIKNPKALYDFAAAYSNFVWPLFLAKPLFTNTQLSRNEKNKKKGYTPFHFFEELTEACKKKVPDVEVIEPK